MLRQSILPVSLLAAALLNGCRTLPTGSQLPRRGDEIVVAGQLFHTGTRVVTWMDPGGYDAYRVERRFSPLAESSWEASRQAEKSLTTPNRYNSRRGDLPDKKIEEVRGGGWDLPTLQTIVDQFVLHYDVCGVSKVCFNVLHDHRDLSVHFMLDVDGTIYQTLDLKERARHATIANDRSIGIEIANIGAYPPKEAKPLEEWYAPGPDGKTRLQIPARIGDPKILTPQFTGQPARNDVVEGLIQGQDLIQYDFTPQQYAALIRLTATLCTIFPRINCDYPRGPDGAVIPHKLSDTELVDYHGILGHYHIQTNKTDPGPALQWDRIIHGARQLLNASPKRLNNPKLRTSL